MAFAYVVSPLKQWQDIRGVNAVDGWVEVFLANTDDRATTYCDFNGTLNPEKIRIDNNGRAIIIADSARPYRIEFYDRNGGLIFTQYPVWTVAGGGGMSMVDIQSTDGTVSVQKTSAGGLTTYDLSVDNEDDSRFLDWIKCSWYDLVDGAYVPRYASGTMGVGAKGVNLAADMLYHVTATVRANKTGERSPFYDNIGVHFSLFDGENTVEVQNFTRIVDHSLGLSQDFTVDADIKVGSLASQLVVTIDGAMEGVSFNLVSLDAHRVYSGVPKIPDGIASESWVTEQLADKKNTQSPVSFYGDAKKTVKSISQNADGEMTVEFEDIHLPAEVPNVAITSDDNSVKVTETTDVQTNTKKFDLSVNVEDPLEYGQFRATNVTSFAPLHKVKGNIDLTDNQINLKKGNSYHFTVRGSYVADGAVKNATTISYIEYSSFTNINVNVDNTVTDPQYFEISYDVYNYRLNGNYNVSFSYIFGGKVSELWVEVHNLNGISVNGGSGALQNLDNRVKGLEQKSTWKEVDIDITKNNSSEKNEVAYFGDDGYIGYFVFSNSLRLTWYNDSRANFKVWTNDGYSNIDGAGPAILSAQFDNRNCQHNTVRWKLDSFRCVDFHFNPDTNKLYWKEL